MAIAEKQESNRIIEALEDNNFLCWDLSQQSFVFFESYGNTFFNSKYNIVYLYTCFETNTKNEKEGGVYDYIIDYDCSNYFGCSFYAFSHECCKRPLIKVK